MLFEDELGDARFPDVDAGSLRGWLDRTAAAAEAVTVAREQLEAAERELETSRNGFASHARLAISYGQLYARDNDELVARLGALATQSDLRAPRKRKSAEVGSGGGRRKRTRASEPGERETTNANDVVAAANSSTAGEIESKANTETSGRSSTRGRRQSSSASTASSSPTIAS